MEVDLDDVGFELKPGRAKWEELGLLRTGCVEDAIQDWGNFKCRDDRDDITDVDEEYKHGPLDAGLLGTDAVITEHQHVYTVQARRRYKAPAGDEVHDCWLAETI